MRRLLSVIATACLVAQSGIAQGEKAAPLAAQDEEIEAAVDDLQEVIVSATRLEASLFETAASAARVDASTLSHERAPSTFPEALRDVPGIMVQKTGRGLGSPFVRGLTGFRTVLVIDGIRLNHSAFRDGPNQYWATVDPLSLDRIEVVKGPGSVLYGSDAAGGTVAAFTERADLGSEGEGWRVGGRAYYRFDLAERSHTGRASVDGSHDGRLGFNFGTTYQSFGNANAGGELGRQDGLAYDFLASDAKIRYAATDDLEFELLAQVVRVDDVPRHHSTVDGVGFQGTTIGSDLRRDFDQERELLILTAELFDGAFFERAEVKFAWHSHDEEQNRIRSSGRRDRSGFDLDTWVLTTQLESETEIGTLVYGFDVYYDVVDSFSTRFQPATGAFTEFAQGPVGDDASHLTVGVFLEDRIDLADWGVLTVGGRYSHVEVRADEVVDPLTAITGKIDAHYDVGAGNVSLLGRVTDWLNVFGSARLGFRAPNLSDLSRFDSARSNEVEIPSPDVEPEFFLGFEVGVNVEHERVRAHASFFHTFLFDTVVRTPTGAMIGGEVAVMKDNVGDGFVQGIEAGFDWEIVESLTFSGQVSWVDGEVDTFPTSAPVVSREPLSRLAPVQARFSLVWRPRFLEGLRIEADTEIVGDADRLDTRDRADTQRIPPGGTPGYVLANLRFSYEFLPRKVAFLNFENLSDKNYRVHGSGSQEPGFSVVAGFDLRF